MRPGERLPVRGNRQAASSLGEANAGSQGANFNPRLYPRSYTASLGWKILMLLAGGAMGGGGAVGVWYFGTGHETRGGMGQWIMVAMMLGLSLLGWLALLQVLRSRVVLAPACLEEAGLFSSKRIERSDIASFRVVTHQGISQLFLHSRARPGKKAKVTLLCKPDDAFWDWFSGIVNSDAEAFAADLSEALNDDTIGMNPADRERRLQWARSVARWLGLGSVAVVVWGFVYPRPYELAVLAVALLPIIALGLCWKFGRIFTIADPGKNTARGDLTGMLIMPGVVLVARAWSDVELATPIDVLLPAAVGGLVLTLMAAMVAPDLRKSFGKLALSSILLMLYAGGLLPVADRLFDGHEPKSLPVSIVGKRHTTGKGASAYFELAERGRTAAMYEIHVPFSQYREEQIGTDACLRVHPGALRLAWYSVDTDQACTNTW